MTTWHSDDEFFELIRTELSTCPVSDVMEQLGFLTPMLPHQIQPLRPDKIMVGRAMPVQDDVPVPHGTPKRFDAKPFGLLFESVEALRPHEVYISTGAPTYAARLGDMLITRAKALGAAGLVINGNIRDAEGIKALNIPVYAHGSYAYGLQGRHNVVDYRCSITVGKVRVRPGDLIIGDSDGVCVVPHEAEEEIITRALAKNNLEKQVREAIEGGASVVEAFNKFSVM